MTTKKYVWKFDLEEYLMTKDITEDYKASLRPIRSYDIDGVAGLIAEERTEYRVETLVNTYNMVDAKIRQLVGQNNIVVTGTAIYSPSVQGVFMGKTGVVDPARHRPVVNINPSAAMRAEIEKVSLEFSGNVKDMGGSRIGLVKDVTTGKTDGTITPGGMVDVTGSKIKSVNASGTGLGTITLVSLTDQSESAPITLLGINNPSRLMFNLPANLAMGEYQITIETWYSNHNTQLKQSRTLVYSLPLVVSDDDDDDDRPEIE